MTPQQRLALTAGAVVLVAYAVGSVPFGYVVTRRRLHASLRRLHQRGGYLGDELTRLLAGGGAPRRDAAAAMVLDTAKVLAVATLAWHAVEAVAPPLRGAADPGSAIGFYSDQVIPVWASAALWAGLAAVVGHLHPPWLSTRGGYAPALGLVAVYAPFAFVAGAAGFFLAYAWTRRLSQSVLLSLPVFVGYAWLAWTFDVTPSYGLTNGPELALWCSVLAALVLVRTYALAAPAPLDGEWPQ